MLTIQSPAGHRKMTEYNRHFFEPATRTENHELVIRDLPSLGIGTGAMEVDKFSMGTFFGSDWQVLYESETEDLPLRGVYLHNIKTGQRFAIDINPKQPKIKKMINMGGSNHQVFNGASDHRLHDVIVRVTHKEAKYYQARLYIGPLPRADFSRRAYDDRCRDLCSARYNEYHAAVMSPDTAPFHYFIYKDIGIHVSTTMADLDNYKETFKNCDFVSDDAVLEEAIAAYRRLEKECAE